MSQRTRDDSWTSINDHVIGIQSCCQFQRDSASSYSSSSSVCFSRQESPCYFVADFASPFGPIICVHRRNFNHCHVFSYRIHKPPLRPCPFPLFWQFHSQDPFPNIPIIFPPYISKLPCLASRVFSLTLTDSGTLYVRCAQLVLCLNHRLISCYTYIIVHTLAVDDRQNFKCLTVRNV